MKDGFAYVVERFADIQILRYKLHGFENLSLRQKLYIYYLSEAILWGRDITFDQMCWANLSVRKLLEAVYRFSVEKNIDTKESHALETYLKRVWFSNGIHHHYGGEKFIPEFSPEYIKGVIAQMIEEEVPGAREAEELMKGLEEVIFNPDVLPKRTNKTAGDDLVLTSACHFYQGVTQQQAEEYYASKKDKDDPMPPSWGLNSRLVEENGELHEVVWCEGGCYGEAISHIIHFLKLAAEVAENQQQREVIALLIEYYRTGDLRLFDSYSIKWVNCLEGDIDFINGFIEVYDDPLGIKATWEGIVEYIDKEATKRTQTISNNAQWFENHSPVDPRFRKKVVKGVTANVICAAMLAGEEYPASAIGINLPNADWIRAAHGSKSITISNLTEAYNETAKGSGLYEEFVIDQPTIDLINRYGNACDDLHTDLHECLGHGSGQLLPGADPDALKAYGSTIEEARADLFALYYMADDKLVELGLLPDGEAYKAQYYSYLLNGLITQLRRIAPGQVIEEAHMCNRALIARWVLRHADGAVEMVKIGGKTFVKVNDYLRLREAFATLLAEVQRIKSEGDFSAARQLVEDYAIEVDAHLHQEVLERSDRLNLPAFKGFLNPKMSLVRAEDGEVVDIDVDYSETYTEQMSRYSRDYAGLN